MFVFLFSKFFLFFGSEILSFFPGRKEQEGFRHCWEAWGRGCTNIFTDHLPDWVQGHDHVVKQPRVRGERADGAHTSCQDLSQRVVFSETDFRGYCFYKHPPHSLGQLREIAKGREARRVAVHGVTKRGTQPRDRHARISLAGERGFVWAHWPSRRL